MTINRRNNARETSTKLGCAPVSSASAFIETKVVPHARFVARFEIDVSNTNSFVPPPHDLQKAPYILAAWPSDTPSGSFPRNMVIRSIKLADAGLTLWSDERIQALWRLPYNLVSRSRVIGLGESGIGFLNTDKPQNTENPSYAGAAVLALDTRQQSNVLVHWTARTVSTNPTPYSIRLQYRVGTQGPFLDLETGHEPQEYTANPVGPESKAFCASLPAAALDRPYVQLRWVYYASGERPGLARPCLALDDIVVCVGNEPAAYFLWLGQFPGIYATNASSAWSADADPDRDGAANLLEYAAGSNPDIADEQPRLTLSVIAGKLVFSWNLRGAVEEITAFLEESLDLRDWFAVAPLMKQDGGCFVAVLPEHEQYAPRRSRFFRATLRFKQHSGRP